jgi:hypothetical protein
MASVDKVEAVSCACLIACGYAWKRGGGSQHADDRLVADFDADLVDFGLDLLGVFVCFILKFMREDLLVGRMGVAGVTGVAGNVGTDSVPVLHRLIDMLRRRPASAIALIDLSEIPEAGASSSSTGNAVSFSPLLRVKSDRKPPLDSLL